jgi:YidC/Oxa1 family membrane protein insertase
MNDSKNMYLAIGLSVAVLLIWQVFVGIPQMERQRQIAQQQQQAQLAQQTGQPTPGQPSAGATAPGAPSTPPSPGGQAGTPAVPGQAPPVSGAFSSRDQALAASPRVRIETPRIQGSISLRGGRIDDVSLIQYRATVDRASPAIVLLSPSGAEHPFYAEFGMVGGAGAQLKLPGPDTTWTQVGTGALTPERPVTLSWDNGEGLEFRRIIAIDERYLFTVRHEVINRTQAPVTLFPYGLISRHGTPNVLGYYILHEGLIGVLGDQGLQEYTYKKIGEEKVRSWTVTNAWIGITDKYWAAALLPEPTAKVQARYSTGSAGLLPTYQTDYLLDGITVAPGGTGSSQSRLFAGAKEVAAVDGYDKALGLNRFELLIDWGWFYFITKPLFYAIDWFFKITGNFGIAILIVTVLLKLLFFPLANKSYASMAKMKAVAPQLQSLKERYGDDKLKMQQEMMEIYKKEKINPLSGCLPILIQIPVFFALYKVLFVTIEMRHAPFFGWIQDLSAPDPTSIFNLFGLLPFAVPALLLVGVWPILMGITMWIQMKLNPAPPDPTQKMIFDWMPLIFTFMLASFPAGLVIYWAWNNFLSILQQAFIMRKHGVKIELWDNVLEMFGKKKAAS